MNIDYQINNQQLKTALDDLVKVGVGGRRRKRKLELIYGNEEARFDFQGDVLNITHNGMTKVVEAKGKAKADRAIAKNKNTLRIKTTRKRKK